MPAEVGALAEDEGEVFAGFEDRIDGAADLGGVGEHHLGEGGIAGDDAHLVGHVVDEAGAAGAELFEPGGGGDIGCGHWVGRGCG
ncbi:MAG: hypothetical protein RI897_2338 [Verrucomicrobiota bacterium]